MKNTLSHYLRSSRIVLSASLLCALAVATFADDGAAKSAAAQADGASATTAAPAIVASATPKPDLQKKIYTNEDVEALRKNYSASTVGNAAPEDSLAPASQRPTTRQTRAAQTARVLQLPPEQDPAVYAQQYASASARIADIDAQIQRLRNFRASDAAPGSETPNLNVGLNLYAPADGIGTDAQIQQLLQQRAELDAQLSDLQDRARVNNIDPGVLRRAADSAETAENVSPLSPQEQVVATRDNINHLAAALAQVSGTQAAMHQEAAAQNVKIVPETKFGGNMTANFLKQLSIQKAVFQQQLSTVEDTARHQGLPPNTLP